MSRSAALAAVLLLAGCMTPMTKAALKGDVAALRALVASGADLEATDANGETPLMKSALTDQTEAARILLDAGADPNHGTMFGTPLSYAVRFKRADLAALLLARGAKPTPEAKALAASAAAPRPAPGNLDDAAYDRMRAAAGMPPEKREPVSDVDAPKRRAAQRPDDFALVIGIEDYQSLPKADYGVRDARTMRRHLEALGFPPRNIISLEGAQATGNKLKSYLEEWLPLNVKPDSALFVFYSGHGAPDPKTGDAYLVPWDGDPAFLKSTAYPLSKFYADLSKTKAKRVLVALDACFSGAGGARYWPRARGPSSPRSLGRRPEPASRSWRRPRARRSPARSTSRGTACSPTSCSRRSPKASAPPRSCTTPSRRAFRTRPGVRTASRRRR